MYLHHDIHQYNHKRKSQIEEEPNLDWFDVGSAGQGGWHGEVDGGENHHAGDVDGVQQVVPRLTDDVVAGVVDDVHQDGRQVCYHEYAEDFQLKVDSNNYCFQTFLAS